MPNEALVQAMTENRSCVAIGAHNDMMDRSGREASALARRPQATCSCAGRRGPAGHLQSLGAS